MSIGGDDDHLTLVVGVCFAMWQKRPQLSQISLFGQIFIVLGFSCLNMVGIGEAKDDDQ